MIAHLRERAEAALAQPESATLTTYGPAGLQSCALPCRVLDGCLYLLVPRISDQLLNIEHRPEVLVTSRTWQLHGRAGLLTEAEIPTAFQTERLPEAAWSAWVAVDPLRLTLLDSHQKCCETIDFK